MPEARTDSLTRPAWSILCLLAGVCVGVHLALWNRFGYHLDELYFMECAGRLAWGYVDHPPLVPGIARAGMAIFGENLFALRFFPALASGGAVVLTGLIAREFGGGRYAQGLAGLAALVAPAYLRSGGLLCIPVFELLFWPGFAYCVIRTLNGRDPRWWIAAGIAAGLGLLTKYGMAFWGSAMAAGIVLTPARKQLRTPWPWIGAAAATGLFLPHLIWEHTHGWPSLEFLHNLRADVLEEQSRPLFLLQQVINMLPLLVPLWAMGLWFLFTRKEKRFRAVGWAFVLAFLFFFLQRGKAYYLAPAYTVLFAGGCVLLESLLAGRRCGSVHRQGIAAVVVIVGGLNALFALPVIPLETADRLTARTLGRFVDPHELSREFHSQYGWQELADDMKQAYEALPPEEQSVCTIMTLKYSQASAVNFFGKPHGLPRAVSGHMNFYLWGPDPGRGEVAIACGFPRDMLETLYGDIREVGRTFHPLARDEYNNLPIYVCRNPQVELAEAWPRFKRYYHTAEAWRDQAPVR